MPNDPKEKGRPRAKPGDESPVQAAPTIYVGPTLSGKVHLATNSVFLRGELPPRLLVAAESDSDLARLIVPLADLADARNELKDRTSGLARAAAAVARNHRGA